MGDDIRLKALRSGLAGWQLQAEPPTREDQIAALAHLDTGRQLEPRAVEFAWLVNSWRADSRASSWAGAHPALACRQWCSPGPAIASLPLSAPTFESCPSASMEAPRPLRASEQSLRRRNP